ncbi:MAG: hypothetical protein PHS96_09650, partial [Anaerolineales bacterium]|nr:hypothetical protein [Anaerolineales bacterium]
MARILDGQPGDTAVGSKKQGGVMSDAWFSVLLILPAMIIIGFFALVPLLYAINVSFHFADLTRGGIQQFVGLENYRIVLFDDFFWESVGTTVLFT